MNLTYSGILGFALQVARRAVDEHEIALAVADHPVGDTGVAAPRVTHVHGSGSHGSNYGVSADAGARLPEALAVVELQGVRAGDTSTADCGPRTIGEREEERCRSIYRGSAIRRRLGPG
jgi:hypothetical protein